MPYKHVQTNFTVHVMFVLLRVQCIMQWVFIDNLDLLCTYSTVRTDTTLRSLRNIGQYILKKLESDEII